MWWDEVRRFEKIEKEFDSKNDEANVLKFNSDTL